ncbi:monovalent cation-H antiporter-2, CPA2 family [Legionella beliardensis]|uniref:Monovalent cation-H antiporter-2, CPA2 family n=1 Tax=Legionella beliardensis TaxID=91822 RepID=A0A378I5R4_9GAMM|nr:monovalent cation:proton antiporter-2 (CPA2) family protein [Legionella beliardensis]STX30066.1 monovalent cation-H antiporter-2, CPA2 family [Legionella beliardensis]
MNNNLLTHVFIFLAAAAVIVPIASRFKLSSVLGYLIIGVLIGPFGFKLLGNAEQIMSFAEFGIVMMLFLIGLELEPKMLWRLRKAIVGLGSLQVILTTTLLAILGILLGYKWQESLAVGMALALSSTALVLQMLEEKNLLRTAEGETSFAVLLFQDIAVIPILIILPLLAPYNVSNFSNLPPEFIDFPRWLHALFVIGIISLIILMGHFLSHRLFFILAKTNLREVFTAASLAIVIGITLLMQIVGASPALGAFIAGVVLANSQYKHTLEMDIEPFKGLLLGLFFISVGMSMDFNLFREQPLTIITTVFTVIIIKASVLIILGYLFNLTSVQRIGFALALSQAGEFAFVVFQFADHVNVISKSNAHFFNFVVALSMALTPFLMLFYHRFIVPRYLSTIPLRNFDTIRERNSIILAGYGRFGQIIGRFLRAQDVHLTVLEKDPEQIELLRKFGFQGYFGDATRLDLLRNAGANEAKILIVAVGSSETSLKIVKIAKQYFPNLKIYARAHNRRHAYELHKEEVNYFRRETFDSSLLMAREVMVGLGYSADSIRRKAKIFADFDEKSLQESFEFFEKESELIRFFRYTNIELERILQNDQQIESLYRRRKTYKAK